MRRHLKLIISLFMLLSLLLNISFASAAEEKEWIRKNEMPKQLIGSVAVEVSGKIYVFGGTSSSSTDIQKDVYEFDPVNDSWTKKNDMPVAKTAFTAAAVDGKIYVFGGYTGDGYTMSGGSVLNSVNVYDPSTDKWDITTKSNMPIAKAWSNAVTFGDQIYVIGGINSNVQTLATVDAYDTKTNSWTSKASMPTALHAVGLAVFNDKIYAVGGGNGSTSYNTVREYDPQTNLWTDKANLLVAKDGSGTAVLNGLIYSIGGAATNGDSLKDVEVYNPLTNTWATAPNLLTARTAFGSVAAHGSIYAIGGGTFAPYSGTKTVEEFTPKETPEPTVTPEPTIEPTPTVTPTPSPSVTPSPTPEQPTGDRAILVVTMNTGLEKEFDLPMSEINAFLNWYDTASGSARYGIDKHDNNKGPFTKRTDYVLHDKILTFEVSEYTTQ